MNQQFFEFRVMLGKRIGVLGGICQTGLGWRINPVELQNLGKQWARRQHFLSYAILGFYLLQQRRSFLAQFSYAGNNLLAVKLQFRAKIFLERKIYQIELVWR